MAKSGSGSTLLLLGGAGAAAYWLYSQGYFANLFSPAAAPASGGAPAPGGAAAGGAAPTVISGGAPPSAPISQPSYSGPSLDQMFQSLQNAVAAAVGSDSALSCPGLGGLGIVRRGLPAPSAPVSGPRYSGSQSPGVIARSSGAPGTVSSGRPGVNPIHSVPPISACTNPSATYDVFNWYLVNRANVGVSAAPAPPDHTSVVTLQQYWAWAAPLLQAQMPGLAGVFPGLGMYGELARIVGRQKGEL